MSRSSAWEGWTSTLLLALVGGIVAVSPQLPPGTRSLDNSASSLVPDQRSADPYVWARPWEDPLLAVSSLDVTAHGPHPTPARCLSHDPARRSIALRTPPSLPDSNNEVASVRVVMVEMLGGDGAEDEEDRRGCRRALLQGLGSAGFSPAFRGRLFAFPFASQSAAGLADRLAVEYFKRDDELCAVAYVPARSLIDRDALGLCECMAFQLHDFTVGQVRQSRTATQMTLAEITIVRRDSRAMMDDLAEVATTWTRDASVPVRVLNFMSTIDAEILRSVAGQQIDARPLMPISRVAQFLGSSSWRPEVAGNTISCLLRHDRQHDALNATLDRIIARESEPAGVGNIPLTVPVSDHGWQIGRMLGSDDRLITQLVDELKLRRRSPNNPRNAVAIITEAGHPYSDKFYEALESEVGDHAGLRGDPTDRLYHLKFTAGLDIPPLNEAGRQAYRMYADPANAWHSDGFSASTPLGMHGIDYIHRQLCDVEAGLNHDQRLAAILICATDERDKRPLIQLIKREFPNALVMTSDLHALMTDPSDLHVMRNVVVASHLNLQTGPLLQDDWPPFRSAYRTSLFLGMRSLFYAPPSEEVLATSESILRTLERSHEDADRKKAAEIRDLQTLHATIGSVRSAAPGGRIYEIGDSGARLLNTPAGASPDSVYYPPPRRPTVAYVLALLTILAVITAIPLALQTSVRDQAVRLWANTRAGARIVSNRRLLNRWWRTHHAEIVGWTIRWGAAASLIAATLSLLTIAYLERREHLGLLIVLMCALMIGAVMLAVRAYAPLRIRTAIWDQIRRPLTNTTFVGRSWLAILAMLAIASVSGMTTFTWGIVGVIGCAALLMMLWSTFADTPSLESLRPDQHPRIKLVQPIPSSGIWTTIHRRGMWLLFSVFTVGVVGLFLFGYGSGSAGEPWGWFDGVSVWPSMLIRLSAVFLGAWFFYRCCRVQAEVDDRATCISQLRPGFRPHMDERPPRTESLASHYRRVSLTGWNTPMIDRGTTRERVCVAALLRQLRAKCTPEARFMRFSIYLAMITAVVIGAMAIVGIPDAPIRGRALYLCHVALMWAHAVILNLTVLAMLDTTLVAATFVQHLYGHSSEWPAEIRRLAEDRTGVHRDEVSPWLDVKSVANLTRDVNGLVYFPMILITLSAAAWHPSIDAWTINWLLIVIYGVSLPLCVIAAYLLRRTARRLPGYEIERLETRLATLRQHDEQILTDLRESVQRNPDCEVELKLGPNRDLYLESLRVIDPESDAFGDRGTRRDPDEVIPELAAAIVAYAGPTHDGPPTGATGDIKPDATLRVPIQSLSEPAYAPLLPALQRLAESAPRKERRDAYVQARCDGIRTLIAQIQRVKDGAFAPWTEDPIFRGVAAPVLGFLAVKASEMMGFGLV